MTKNEMYYFLVEYYGSEKIATDLCNFYDSAQLEEFVQFLKDGA